MAEGILKTERVEKVVYEDKEVVVLTMSRQEADTAYSSLWLTELHDYTSEEAVELASVRSALAEAIGYPPPKFQVDSDHPGNSCTVFIKRK